MEHLRAHRGHRRRLRRPDDRGRARCGSGTPWPAGTWRWWTSEGEPVEEGDVGELVIGGVGLARYLDPARDAEKYAAAPRLGWDRAYRSGDLVRFEAEGLVFVGRADDQVKLGGRRIELGEVDAALQGLPGVAGAAAAVRTATSGHQVLVGYLAPAAEPSWTWRRAARSCGPGCRPRWSRPLAVVDALPDPRLGQGRPGRPPVAAGADRGRDDGGAVLPGTAGWLAARWTRTLGVAVTGPDHDFFDDGGGSLAAAQLVSPLRERYPEVTVADVYDNPRLGDLAEVLDEFAPPVETGPRGRAPDARAGAGGAGPAPAAPRRPGRLALAGLARRPGQPARRRPGRRPGRRRCPGGGC